jgi:hypothetical protein
MPALRFPAIFKNHQEFGPVFCPNRDVALGGARRLRPGPAQLTTDKTIAAHTTFNVSAHSPMLVFLNHKLPIPSTKSNLSHPKKVFPKC